MKKTPISGILPFILGIVIVGLICCGCASADAANSPATKAPKEVTFTVTRVFAAAYGECDSHYITFMGFHVSGEYDRPKKGTTDVLDLLRKDKCDVDGGIIQGGMVLYKVTFKSSKGDTTIEVSKAQWDTLKVGFVCKNYPGYPTSPDVSTCKKKK